MAMDLSRNPLIFDAAAQTTSGRFDKVKIDRIRWVGPTTSGHICQLKDLGGKVIFKEVATGANVTEDVGSLGWVNGITVDTLDSGVLHVYIR